MGDELFDAVPRELWHKIRQQSVIASDLARLYVCHSALRHGFACVIWLDADFLIFAPAKLNLPDVPYALGREIWVQYNKPARLKVYTKVHNAFLMFRQGNSLLDFYIESAERLLKLNKGPMPPQYIGPKLLTALHNITHMPVVDTAGMLSPLVIKDIIQGSGAALDLFMKTSATEIAGANLCTSSRDKGEVEDSEMVKLIEVLLSTGLPKINRQGDAGHRPVYRSG